MSQLKADKMNGAAVHRGAIATTIQAQAGGVGSTAIRGTCTLEEAGGGVQASASDTSRSMTTTMNMPIEGTTGAATAVVRLTSLVGKPMAH